MVMLLLLYSQLCYPVVLCAARLNMKSCRPCKPVKYDALKKTRDVRLERKTKAVNLTDLSITIDGKGKIMKVDNSHQCVYEKTERRSMECKELNYSSSSDLVQHLEKHRLTFELVCDLSRRLATLQS